MYIYRTARVKCAGFLISARWTTDMHPVRYRATSQNARQNEYIHQHVLSPRESVAPLLSWCCWAVFHAYASTQCRYGNSSPQNAGQVITKHTTGQFEIYRDIHKYLWYQTECQSSGTLLNTVIVNINSALSVDRIGKANVAPT
jgi:hypothetical protein